MSETILSKNWFSTVHNQQSMKRAHPATPFISNYHKIAKTTDFVSLTYLLWDHMPLLAHWGTVDHFN